MTFKERIQQFRNRVRVARFVKDLNQGRQLDLLSRTKYWAAHADQVQSYADMECNWALLPSSVVKDLPNIIDLLRTDPHQSYLEKGFAQAGRFGILGAAVVKGLANVGYVGVSRLQDVKVAFENTDMLDILNNKQLMGMIENKWARDYWSAHPEEYRDFGSKSECEWVLLPKDLEQQLYDFIDPMNVSVRQKRRKAKEKKVPLNASYKQAFVCLNKGLDALHDIRKAQVQQLNQEIKVSEETIKGLMEANKELNVEELRKAYTKLNALQAQKINSREIYSQLPSGVEKAKIDVPISEFKKALGQAAVDGLEIAKIDLATYALGEDPYNIIGPFYTQVLSEEEKETNREILTEITQKSIDPLCKQRAQVALNIDNIKMHRAVYSQAMVSDLRSLARISRTGGDLATRLWANNFCNTILNDEAYTLYKKDMRIYLDQERELAHKADTLKVKLYEQQTLVNQKPPVSSFRAWFDRFVSQFLGLFSSSLPNEVFVEKEPQSEFGEILTEAEKMDFELCSHEELKHVCNILWEEYYDNKKANNSNAAWRLKKAQMAEDIYVRRTSGKPENPDKKADLAVLSIQDLQSYLFEIQYRVKKTDQKMLEVQQALEQATAQGPLEDWKRQSLEWDVKWAQQNKAQEDQYAAFIGKILAKKIGDKVEEANSILINPQASLVQKEQARADLTALQKDTKKVLDVTDAFILTEKVHIDENKVISPALGLAHK